MDRTGGVARDPARALGRAGRLVLRGRALPGPRFALPPEGPSDPTSSSVAPASRARCASRRPTPTSTTSARRPPTRCATIMRRPRRGLREGRARPGHAHALGHGRRARRARRGRLRAASSTPRWRSSASAAAEARPGSTHVATAGSSGRPTRPRARIAAYEASPASSACSTRYSCRATSSTWPARRSWRATVGLSVRGRCDAAASSGTRAARDAGRVDRPRRPVSRSTPTARRRRPQTTPSARHGAHALDEQAIGLTRVSHEHELDRPCGPRRE